MTISVLDGLQAAHRQGLVHGDIEPGSIVVTGEGRACLTRFGLNRAAAVARRVPCFDGIKLARSKRMSAPEVISGEAPTVASDLYSIGAILYEAIAGRGHRRDEVADAEVLPLRDARSQVPAALAEVIDGLLSNDPSARAESASTLRRDLTQAMMKAPTVAKLNVATAIETPKAEPTQQLDIEDLESQSGLQDALAASEAPPATSPAADAPRAEPSVVVADAAPRAAASPEPAAPAKAPASEEKSKAPLLIGLTIAVLIIIALVSMLGGGEEASEAAPVAPAEAIAAAKPEAAEAVPAAALPPPVVDEAPTAAPQPEESPAEEPAVAEDEATDQEPAAAAPVRKAAPKKKATATTRPAETKSSSKVKRDPGF
jgi:eukaryotic-like serine/threonine-protein kinase